MGGCMQPRSPDDAFRHEIAPQQRKRMAEATSDAYEEQGDQWAVLRHEVEVEDMKQQGRRAKVGREQRNTEEDTIFPQPSIHRLEEEQHHVDIVVAGVGGGGMNAVNRMISTRVRGVRFIAMNTDAQALSLSEAPIRICLGERYTKGLGAGGNAPVGTRAATESQTEIRDALGNPDLVFIAAGLGGGTGTGATPVIASIAKKLGALTIGILTLPFTFEGSRRRRIAEEGIAELSTEIDALISVPNDRLLSLTGKDRNLVDAFKLADDVLRQGVQGIAEVINVPGLVNVDFADVRSVLNEAGTALMSIGQGYGRNRAQRAAEEAIAGGFLNVTIRGAQRVLFNISGGEDMTLFEVNEVAESIGSAVDNTADITFGAVIDPTLYDMVRVTLIAAGMEERRLARLTNLQASRADQPHPVPVDSTQLTQAVSYVAPVPTPPAGPAQSRPASFANPPVKPSPTPVPQTRLPGPPARPQRSLDDLRGLRSLGRHQKTPQAKQTDEAEEKVD